MSAVNGRAMKARGSALERRSPSTSATTATRTSSGATALASRSTPATWTGCRAGASSSRRASTLDLAGWCDEAERERQNAGCDFAAVDRQAARPADRRAPTWCSTLATLARMLEELT